MLSLCFVCLFFYFYLFRPFHQASTAKLVPERVADGTQAFMFESCLSLKVQKSPHSFQSSLFYVLVFVLFFHFAHTHPLLSTSSSDHKMGAADVSKAAARLLQGLAGPQEPLWPLMEEACGWCCCWRGCCCSCCRCKWCCCRCCPCPWEEGIAQAQVKTKPTTPV